ncbi:FAD-binding protein [Nocardiopsis sp. MG754419]|nr:FAD-binding protein [Nocardiopsis sp. MG754419]
MARLKTRTISDKARRDLRPGFSGAIFLPDDEGYEEARTPFNTMIDLRPGVIAQCASVDDVRHALALARAEGAEVSVRGGGHSVAGMSLTDGGLVIDMRRMNTVTVDPEAMEVRVGGGTLMGAMDAATAEFGLAATGGRVSTTGVAGFALGGGSGWLERKFGLACDNLLGVDMVTADGDPIHASADSDPELFWALHGGGGNFGVATGLTFRLHRLPEFTLGLLLFRPERGPEVARAWRDVMETAPDEIGGGLIYLVAQAEPFIPEELVDTLMCAAVFTCVGDEEMLREVAGPLLRMAPDAQLVAEMPYPEAQKALDDPPGFRNYWSVEHLSSLPNEALDRFCTRAEGIIVPSPTGHILFPFGGAMGRAQTDYPVPWRFAAWGVHPLAIWENAADDDRARQWVRDVRSDMAPWATGDVYLNFTADEGRERVVAGLGEDNYRRLSAVKDRLDPDNVFHRNHNVRPSRAEPTTAAPKPRRG